CWVWIDCSSALRASASSTAWAAMRWPTYQVAATAAPTASSTSRLQSRKMRHASGRRDPPRASVTTAVAAIGFAELVHVRRHARTAQVERDIDGVDRAAVERAAPEPCALVPDQQFARGAG